MNLRAKTLFCTLMAVFAVGFYATQAESSLPSKAPERAKVLVQELQATDDVQRLLVPAKVEAKVASLVTAEIEGLVTNIKKPLGSVVKAGDVVLYVENKDPAFTYAKVPVRAPISGVVSQINPTLMSRVNRGDKLFVVIDPHAIRLSVEIPGSDLGVIKPGAKGVFKRSIDDNDGTEIQVTGVSPLVDPRTGTASAELEFTANKANQGKLPAIGMVGYALFETTRGKVLLIPEVALGYSDGKPIVKVLDGAGVVEKKLVELGEQKESQLVIKSGLVAGDKLIVRSNRSVKEGETVDIEPEAKKN